ncbi:MAG: N,N-dimethylformamidase beta subunit family domain-containing protein, partial [Pararhizobium sp.]
MAAAAGPAAGDPPDPAPEAAPAAAVGPGAGQSPNDPPPPLSHEVPSTGTNPAPALRTQTINPRSIDTTPSVSERSQRPQTQTVAPALLAAPQTNPIVAENQKPGTPVSTWAIHGDLDAVGDTNIEGFATQISVNRGQTVSFKINTDSKKYRIDIYRLGYYGGNGATLVTSINENLANAQIQPNPLFNAATRTVDAGNWAVSASWAVPSDATSGVYFAKLTRTDGVSGENMIPFIVRADGTTSDITFQTSDETWQAYNPWGGYNVYQGPDGSSSDRAYAVSYNRPIAMNSTSNEAGPQDFVFGEELPAIEWLEQNGYNVSYISGIDAATNPSSVLNGKVYMDVGHDEYWSLPQYQNVQAAADAGVSLMFLSGNQTYWDVKFAPSLDASATPNRTLIEYKDPWDNTQLNPSGTAGGGSSTFRDTVFGPGVPENGLSGTIFQVDDNGTLQGLTVGSDFAKLSIWKNTAVANLAPGQSVTLSNLLGYEWDTDNNNGFRPAGLIDLSSTTLFVPSLITNAAGTQEGSGTATHNLVLFRDPKSGALVFSTGTVMWSWGLSDQHALYRGLTAPVSSIVQQSMVNALAEMGVQPGTLQASLVLASQSADTSPPVSTITAIGSGGTLSSNQIATVKGTAQDVGGGIVAAVEVSTDGGQTWSRATGTTNWTYSWIVPKAGSYTVETRAVDDNAFLEKPSDATTVTVTGSTSASIFSKSPGDPIPFSSVADNPDSGDTTSKELGVKFTVGAAGTISAIRFYKGLKDTGTHTASLWSSTGTLLATGTATNETASGWQTVTFQQPVSVTAGTSYVASFHSSGHYVLDSNFFASPNTAGSLSTGVNAGVSRTGTTSAFPNQTAANGENYWVDVVYAAAPVPPVANNDQGFTTSQNTALTISASTLLANDSDPNGDTLSVTGVSAPSHGTVTFDATNKTVTFTPTSGYTGPAGFTYSISDGTGGTASAQVSLAVTPPGTVENLFPASTTPTVASDGDPGTIELGVKFSAAVAGQVTSVSYYKSANDTGTHTGALWTAGGTLLASGTFTNETASGWQTLVFSSPIAITAGTTYVAGFHSNGHYAATPGFFNTAYTNGDLSAPVNAGVYTYG